MKNTYLKPESEVVLPEMLVDYLDGETQVSNMVVNPDPGDAVDPGDALGNESPIWDDTQK